MQGKPNLILLSLDAVRADALSCYGHEKPTTPFLDDIARQGLRFTRCFANASWTPPSHGTMFTGQYSSVHGVRGRRLRLRPEVPTLAEQLQAHGYETFGISSNPWVGVRTGLERGFDTFLYLWQKPHPLREPALFLDAVLNKGRRRLQGGTDGGAYRIRRAVGRWMRKRARQPFFLFLHYQGAHTPYLAPRTFFNRFAIQPDPADLPRLRRVAKDGGYSYMAGYLTLSDRDWEIVRSWYDAKVAGLDHSLARLFDDLGRAGLLDDTLIVVTSDHGENLGDHGLAYHDFCLYDTLLHVPLILLGSGVDSDKGDDDRLVSHIDLVPTLLTAAGVEFDGTRYPGQDLLAADGRKDAVFAELGYPRGIHVFKRLHPDFDYGRFERTMRAVRTGQWKYIQASDGCEELYDIIRDPAEERNLVREEVETRNDLRLLLDATLEAGDVDDDESFADAGYTVHEEAAIMARLQELGYA